MSQFLKRIKQSVQKTYNVEVGVFVNKTPIYVDVEVKTYNKVWAKRQAVQIALEHLEVRPIRVTKKK